MDVNTLRVPLNHLYYIDDLPAFAGLIEEEIASLKSQDETPVLKEMLLALKWAKTNPLYDFSSLLPNLMKCNEEIYGYLCKVDSSLEGLRSEING